MTPDTELRDLTVRLLRAERRARLSAACAVGALGLTALLSLRPAVLAQSPGVSLASVVARITALETKTAPITTTGSAANGYLLTISKANVQIVDGQGSTNDGGGTLSGLGNLIIGYNAPGNYNSDDHSGSHNLILGDQNNYSSFGGIVVGTQNTIEGPYASVTGGESNDASGPAASITGGESNGAAGEGASVTGGSFNNTGIAPDASISGGFGLAVHAPYGWAAGGLYQSGFGVGGSGGRGTYHSP